MEDSTLNQIQNSLGELCRLVRTLRGENGCPWDKKQTPESVGIYLIEEVYELVDAIESGASEQICEELGDVLFHIVFVARMFEERGAFDLSRVARVIVEKMIRRHPHVFGAKEVDGSAEVIQDWYKIKLNEKKNQKKHSQFDSVPAKLPALLRAYRILDRVAHSGFDFRAVAVNAMNAQDLAGEIQAALNACDHRLASRKFGDLLFALINVARLADVHAERALAGSVKKFEARFKKMEALVNESQLELDEISLEEKKRIWEKVLKIFP